MRSDNTRQSVSQIKVCTGVGWGFGAPNEAKRSTTTRSSLIYAYPDYYAPLTAANLQASTSRLQDSNTSPSTSITRDRRSLETRELIDAYSSYYIEEPVPQIPSTYLNRQQSVSESVERRRRKRERAATFVHDEEARQAVARQIAEEEARLRAAEAQAMDHRRAREREAREQKRKQDRAAALARLEAEQLREDAYKQQQRLAEQERQAQLEANARQEGEETRRWEALAHAQRRADRQEAKRQQLQAEAAHQKQADDLAARQRQQTQAQILKEEERVAAQREEEGRQLRQQQRENARRTRDLENAEKERTRALNEASESQRIQELEAEVQRLRRELEEARRKQEEAAALSAQNSRHVHFAPTPPDSLHAEQSFLTQSSSSYSLQGGIKLPPPAPPPPAPPPPPASLAGISKSAKPTPLALLAAHKASTKMAENAKKRPSIVNAAVGMPADMGKFLSEMKNTKLKKVGLPVEGAKKRRDEEETGLKSILGALIYCIIKRDSGT